MVRILKRFPTQRRRVILYGLIFTGAMIMLYIQVTQVMLRRPKRSGNTFWFIIAYSTILFPLTTIAFGGKFRFAETLYLTLSDSNTTGVIDTYWQIHSTDLSNVMSETWCVLIIASGVYEILPYILQYYYHTLVWRWDNG